MNQFHPPREFTGFIRMHPIKSDLPQQIFIDKLR